MTNQQAKVVSSFKGLDQEIFINIDPHKRERFFSQLTKELCIIAETAQRGAGEKLEILIRKYLENQLSFSEIRNELNALVEIGKSFEALDESLKELVHRAEIQQEFYHFSRIMGHDRIFKRIGQTNELELVNEVKDFARFLVLVLERRIERGIKSRVLPFYHSTEQEGNVSADKGQIVMKSKNLNVNAVLFVKEDDKQTTEDAKRILNVFEKFLAKYSFDVSCALLDYYCFLKPGTDKFAFFTCQEYQESGQRRLRICNVGSNACLVLARPGKGNFFEKEAVKIVENCGFEGQRVGQKSGINYGITEIKVPQQGLLAVLSSFANKQAQPLSREEINKKLNLKDSKGKIHPQNNLASMVGSAPVFFGFGKAREIEDLKWDKEAIDEGLANVDISPLIQKKQIINIEAGHIHADRRLGQVQIDGINIAAKFGEILRKRTEQTVENVAMVDEYHVTNSLDYRDYLDNLKSRGFEARELVYESSPLVLEVALDVFKKLEREQVNNADYRIIYEGDSVYLEFSDDGKLVELIEDANGNFSLGCVLFEVGLCLYKRYGKQLTNKFQQIHGLQANYDIHEEMTRIYLENREVGERNSKKNELIPQLESGLGTAMEKKEHTPYLEEIKKARTGGGKKLLINVLEDFYHPQQRKLNRMLELIGEEGIFSLYFNNNREIYLKRS